MPTIIPANNWEPLPDKFDTGFAPDSGGRPITIEEVIVSMEEVAKSMPINEKDLLKRKGE